MKCMVLARVGLLTAGRGFDLFRVNVTPVKGKSSLGEFVRPEERQGVMVFAS
jgi:hypothetical protein